MAAHSAGVSRATRSRGPSGMNAAASAAVDEEAEDDEEEEDKEALDEEEKVAEDEASVASASMGSGASSHADGDVMGTTCLRRVRQLTTTGWNESSAREKNLDKKSCRKTTGKI